MLYQIISSAWKDLKVLSKDTGGLIVLFLMPAMFLLVMSVALSGLFSDDSGLPLNVLVVNQDAGSTGAALVDDLKAVGGLNVETQWQGAPLSRDKAEELIAAQKRSIAVVIPADFTLAVNRASLEAQDGASIVTPTIDLVTDPATAVQVWGPVKGALAGLTQQAISRRLMPQGVETLFRELGRQGVQIPPSMQEQFEQQAQQSADTQAASIAIRQTLPPGMKITKFPNTVQQNVPGWALYGVFFISQQLATSLMEEKETGTFRRLLVAPMSRAAILLGKLLSYLVISLIQIALMFAVGVVVLPLTGLPRLDLGAHPESLFLISLAAALSATGLGLMLAALGKTSAQIGGLGTLLVLTMAALGGVMAPRFVMPDFMQALGLITPHAWALTAYQDILVRGYGLFDILPEVGALLVFTAAFFGVALWRFKWD